MPASINPASITTGAGVNPQGTVEDSSLLYPQRDTDSLRAHLLDPHDAHMAATIGIVDAGGYYSSTEVEGALQELGSATAGISASRQNGVLTNCTYSAVGTTITLNPSSRVLLGASLVDVSGQSVALPANGTNYVYVDSTGALTFNAALPPLTASSVLITEITTTAGAITGSRDGRFFVADLDRKLDYSVRSDGSSQNNEAEACFVTLDAALFWLQNYGVAGQEKKSIIYIRGEHTLTGTITLPTAIENLTFIGEEGAVLKTGGSLAPMFDVSGTKNVTFKNLVFRCEHVGSTAIGTLSAAALTTGLRVESCAAQTGAQAFDRFLDLNLGARHDRHVITGCSIIAAQAVRILNAGSCLVDDSTVTGTSLAGSVGVELRGTTSGTSTDGCLISFVRSTLFEKHFFVEGWNQTITDCSCLEGRAVEARNVNSLLVHNGNFLRLTDKTAGIYLDGSQNANITDCYLAALSTSFSGVDDPAGISGTGSLARTSVLGCRFFNFYNQQIPPAYDLGAAIRSLGSNSRIVSCGILGSGIGVDQPGSSLLVDSCEISSVQRGMLLSSDAQVQNTSILTDSAGGLSGIEMINSVVPSDLYVLVNNCKILSGRTNPYDPTDYPAGIMTNNKGTLKVSNSQITGFYNTVGQLGGGVLVSSLRQASLIGCVFTDNGITINPLALPNVVDNVIVSGCSFVQTNASINFPGIYLDAPARPLTDLTITDCQFTLTSLSARAIGLLFDTIARVKVSGCTYTNSSVGASTNSFLYAQGGTSVFELSASNNTLSIPSGTTSPAFQVNALPGNITSVVRGVLFSGNQVKAVSSSAGLLAFRVAGEVTFSNNLVEGMGGIDLGVSSTDNFAKIDLHNNRFFGSGFPNSFKGVFTSVSIPTATTYYMKGIFGTGNFFSQLDQVIDFNPTLVGTGACSLGAVTLTGNKVEDCFFGIEFVGGGATGGTSEVNISGNEIFVRRWALLVGSASTSTNSVSVCENRIDSTTIGGSTADPLVKVTGTLSDRILVRGNKLTQTGNQGGDIYVENSDVIRNIEVSGNEITYNSPASNGYSVYVTSTSPTSSCSNITLNGNKVVRALSSHASVYLALVATNPGVEFSEIQLCGNTSIGSSSLGGSSGVRFSIGGALPIFAGLSVKNVKVSGNLVRDSFFGIFLNLPAVDKDNIVVEDNIIEFPTAEGIHVTELTVPNSKARNVSVSRNKIYNGGQYRAFYVRSASLLNGLRVDENLISKNAPLGSLDPTLMVELGDAGLDDVGAGISVSRNSITPEDDVTTVQGTYAIWVGPTGAVTNPNITNVSIEDNLIYRHAGGGIWFSPRSVSAYSCSLSRNKIYSVAGSGITVGASAGSTTAFQNLLICENQMRTVGATGIVFGGGVASSPATNLSVSQNQISDAVGRAIYLTPTTAINLKIENNHAQDVLTSSAGFYGVHVLTSSITTASIQGNIIEHNNDGGLLVLGSGGLVNLLISSNNIHTNSTSSICAEVSGSSLAGCNFNGNILRGNLGGFRIVSSGAIVSTEISSNEIRTNSASAAGIYLTASGGVEEVSVTNNILSPLSSGQDGIYFTCSGVSRNLSFSENTIESVDGALYLLFNTNSVRSIGVDKNIIYSCVNGITLDCAIATFHEQLSVSDNQISVTGTALGNGRGISFLTGVNASRAGRVEDLKIEGNLLENTGASVAGASEALIDARFDWLISDVENISISNNKTRGGLRGIWFRVARNAGTTWDCSNVRVCENEVYDWDGAAFGILVIADGNSGTDQRIDAVSWTISNNRVRASINNQGGISWKVSDQSVNIDFSHNQIFAPTAVTGFEPFDTEVVDTSLANSVFNLVVVGNAIRNADTAPSHTGPGFNGGTVMGNISTNGTATLWATWAGAAITSNLLPAVVGNYNVQT